MGENKFVFGKDNYQFIVGGLILSILGFFLMIGGGSDDPNEFNASELFSDMRITIAPFLVIAGYVAVIYGIMKKRKVN